MSDKSAITRTVSVTMHDSFDSVLDLIAARGEMARTATPSLAGKPYCPSSGSEGLDFENNWCGNCQHYREIDAAGVWDCTKGILIQAESIANTSDPRFPKEWRYDEDGMPSCAAFQEREEGDDGKLHRLCGGAVNAEQERAAYERAMKGEA